jgi:hypothetical protein
MIRNRIRQTFSAEQRRAQLANHRTQTAFNSSARSRVNVVTSAGLGRPNRPKPPDPAVVRLSSIVSIGSSRRYSIRRATSAGVGADSVPCTTSPFCVRAR